MIITECVDLTKRKLGRIRTYMCSKPIQDLVIWEFFISTHPISEPLFKLFAIIPS